MEKKERNNLVHLTSSICRNLTYIYLDPSCHTILKQRDEIIKINTKVVKVEVEKIEY